VQLQVLLVFSVLVIFGAATSALAAYGLHLYVLLLLFRRRVRSKTASQQRTVREYPCGRAEGDWPHVTTQIPIYNEWDVAERILSATAAMDYPKGRHEIQVLDDSTDGTRQLIDNIVGRMRAAGADIKVVRRATRTGYKAGALAHGLTVARGEYIAIFDADFVPPADFLRKAVPLIATDGRLACLQGRWTHLNRDESWLTEAQALGVDGHFAIEQGARAWNGLMMNFNGTAGIWRRTALEDPAVGGWSADTLTEDLDISYRAQLAGWRLDYCFDLPCPAELPNTIAAFKSQQRRWATGSIQVARKLLPRIWLSRIGLGEKLEATLHLTHYSVSFWMFVLALIALPMARIVGLLESGSTWMKVGWLVVLCSTVAPSLVYMYARHLVGGRWSGIRTIPSMLVLGCGLCVSNALAFLRGLFTRGGEFVRTPKSGSMGTVPKASSYQVVQSRLWMFEMSLGFYTLVTFVSYLMDVHRGISIFMLIYAVGLLITGWMSRPRKPRRAPLGAPVPAPLPSVVGPEPAAVP